MCCYSRCRCRCRRRCRCRPGCGAVAGAAAAVTLPAPLPLPYRIAAGAAACGGASVLVRESFALLLLVLLVVLLLWCRCQCCSCMLPVLTRLLPLLVLLVLVLLLVAAARSRPWAARLRHRDLHLDGSRNAQGRSVIVSAVGGMHGSQTHLPDQPSRCQTPVAEEGWASSRPMPAHSAQQRCPWDLAPFPSIWLASPPRKQAFEVSASHGSARTAIKDAFCFGLHRDEIVRRCPPTTLAGVWLTPSSSSSPSSGMLASPPEPPSAEDSAAPAVDAAERSHEFLSPSLRSSGISGIEFPRGSRTEEGPQNLG
eukprot:s3031_g12.t1